MTNPSWECSNFVNPTTVGVLNIGNEVGEIIYYSGEPVEPVHMESFSISETTFTVAVGQTINISATPNPANSTTPEITWTLGSSAIATITSNWGTVEQNISVKGVSVGSTIIVASADETQITISINVIEGSETITSLNWNVGSQISVNENDHLDLSVEYLPSSADSPNITYTSSNTNLCSVDETWRKFKFKRISSNWKIQRYLLLNSNSWFNFINFKNYYWKWKCQKFQKMGLVKF